MTRLLVSVRSAAEAEIAVDAGVDLIDVKEPRRGSLGSADVETIEAVVRQVAGRRPLSAALGELLSPASLPFSLLRRLQYAKFGLSQCGRRADWLPLWQAAIDRLPREVEKVAVIYADHERADAPAPADIVRHAASVGCRALLFDTYDKSRGSLLAHLDTKALGRIIDSAQRDGLMCVVAGGLRLDDLETILPLEPHLIAVRGAVCQGDRSGTLDPVRVREWMNRLARVGSVQPIA